MLTVAGRVWNSFDVYVFDIDGTLLNCADATHYFAFCHALKQISAQELTLEGVVTHGNTDIGILRDAFVRGNIPESQWRPRLADARKMMCDFVRDRQHELRAEVLPGVRDVLTYLKMQGAKLGVATGNLERIGKLKLESAGLLDYFEFAGWSDNHELRAEVFQSTAAQIKSIYPATKSICVLGDTPADIQAAHSVKLPIIAVATGVFPYDELILERPEACVRSFAELLPSHPTH